MNARQKAKAYKKELEWIKAALVPTKKICDVETIQPKLFRSKVAIGYSELNAMTNIPMADRENIIKNRLLNPLIEELKNNMQVKLTQDDEQGIAYYSTGIYIATERGE